MLLGWRAENEAGSYLLQELTAPVKRTPQYDEIILRTPAARFGTPDEIAGTAIFPASDASNSAAGSVVIRVTGAALHRDQANQRK